MFHKNEYTFKNHLDFVKNILDDFDRQVSENKIVEATNAFDKEIADKIVSFTREFYEVGCAFEKMPSIRIEEKKALGKELSRVPRKYFPDDVEFRLPEIKGERSAYLAVALFRKQLESFLRIYFNKIELSMSDTFSAPLKIPSINDQKARAARQIAEIDRRLAVYRDTAALVRKVGC